MDITTIKLPDSPMNHVCDEVHTAINEFISRETVYIYSPNDRRKLFSLEDREDFVRNSTLSVDEYIQKYNLEYKWKRLNIQENFSYKQQKRFEKSGLSLDDYIEDNNLYSATIFGEDDSNEMYLLDDEEYDDYYEYSNDDNDDDGWGD
jgi:hypothetical protein